MMQATFVASYPDLTQRPEPVLPEFAFLGRSNCGKSSLINYLLQRKDLARTSRQPGKTRLLNYFLIDETYYLVDLPGYGYAKVSKQQRQQWWNLFTRYIRTTDRPLAVLHLLDSRHAPSEQDREVSGIIEHSGRPFALVATKIDKVRQSSRLEHYRAIIDGLSLKPETPFLPTSANEQRGRDEVLGWIDHVLSKSGVEG
jgi:GTP-binding protein